MNALAFTNKIMLMMGWPILDTIEGTLGKQASKAVSTSNDVLSALQDDMDWQGLATTGYVSMTAAVVYTRDVTVSYGSTTLLTSAATFQASDLGKQIMVNTTKTAYRIVAVVSAMDITLDRPWVSSDIAAEEFEVFIGQNQFELPTDYDRMTTEKLYNSRTDSFVSVVSAQEMGMRRQTLGLGLNIGKPEKCTISGINSAGTAQKIHFDTCAEDDYSLEFSYQKRHPELDANDTLIVYPDKDMLYILDMVKARLDRDSELSQTAGQLAAEALATRNKQQQNKESGSSTLRITPDTGKMGRYRRRRR